MPRPILELFLIFLAGAPAFAGPEAFTDVAKLDFSIVQELSLATTDNPTKRALYPPKPKCLLREEAAEALSRAQGALKLSGFGLKVYDCYRPQSVQQQVAPGKDDAHVRGTAVDVTLVDCLGRDVAMPGEYREFASPAPVKGKEAKKNAKRLARAMTHEGFVVDKARWWHFETKDSMAPAAEDFPFSEVK